MVGLVLLWVLFYALHSLLAAIKVKRLLCAWLPVLNRYYRFMYNAQSLVLFAVAFDYQRKLNSDFLFETNLLTTYLGLGLMLLSIILMYFSFKGYDKYEFIGLTQYKSGNFNTALNDKLSIKHLNRLVRHPLYSATFLFLGAYFLYTPSSKNLVFLLISYTYLIIGTLLEEAKLKEQFGKAYQGYQSEVPMFFPKLRF